MSPVIPAILLIRVTSNRRVFPMKLGSPVSLGFCDSVKYCLHIFLGPFAWLFNISALTWKCTLS